MAEDDYENYLGHAENSLQSDLGKIRNKVLKFQN